MRKLKKIGIYTLVFLALSHLIIVATGNQHFYKAMRYTILQGRMGPSLDQYPIYKNRMVSVGTPMPWEKHASYNLSKLSDEELAVHKKYQTVAFSIIKDNKLLFDYFDEGYSDTSKTNSWSMAKSIVSILTGIAIKEGKIKGMDDLAEIYLPELKGSGITIRHLLAMSSDIDFKEQYLNPFGFAAKALYGTDNRALVKKYHPRGNPFKTFDYESGNTLLLGYIIKKATGQTLSDYASEKLWKRIGAEQPAMWSLDDVNEEERAFCCFNSNAHDFARIGQLYLNNGIWNGDTIVNPAYAIETTHLSPTNLTTGEKNDRYGYHWWVTNFNGQEIFYARGIKGQYVFVIPSEKLIIVRLGRKRDENKETGVPSDVWDYLKMGLRIGKEA